MNLPEPSLELEKKLGIFDDADACQKWDHTQCYYLYIFKDPLQLDAPIIYVGQGKSDRMWRHWNHTHNDILKEWVDHWKQSSINFEDVATKLLEGLTQRQSCCLETFLIDKFKPLANKKYFWTPDQTATHSEDERRHHSQLMAGRKQPREGVVKSARSRTNNYTLELYFEGDLVKIFKETTAVEVTNWILENHKTLIAPSSLWATISQRKGRQTGGYSLVEPAGASGLNIKTKLLRSINGNAVVTKDINGKLRVFVSAAAAAKALNINEGDLGSVIRSSYSQSGGYTARNLTETEINRNYDKWPIYYHLKIEDIDYHTFNLTSFCKSHNLVVGTVHKCLSKGTGYVISNGSRVSGSIVHTHNSFELFDIDLEDNLPIPDLPPVSEKKSSVEGVYWQNTKQRWFINIQIDKKSVNFGSTKFHEIAVQVAKYIHKNLDDVSIIESGRQLLRKLKYAADEQVKDSTLNKHSDTAKDRLTQAADFGDILLTLDLPNGNKKRDEYLRQKQSIDLRRAQRYMQLARGRRKYPEQFKKSSSISDFLSSLRNR